MNRMPKVSKETLLLQLKEKSPKDLAVLYEVTLQQFYYYTRSLKIILSKKAEKEPEKRFPFKLTVKLEIAFNAINNGDPFDIAAKKAGISVPYLNRMFYLYKQQLTNMEKEQKVFSKVKAILHTIKTKNMSQQEACALHGVSYSTFQYNYRKGKKKGIFK
jgi:hypothetical protein